MAAPSNYATGTGGATEGAIDDPLVLNMWSAVLHAETLDELWFEKHGLVGKESAEDSLERSSGLPIISRDEFGIGRGQRVQMGLSKQLTRNRPTTARTSDYDVYLMELDNRSGSSGNGVISDYTYGIDSMVDNEESLELYDMEVVVELLKHAVSFPTPEIQNLRTRYKMDDVANSRLRDWLRQEREENCNDAFYDGFSAHIIKNATGGHNAAVAHTQQIWANDATQQSDISNNDTLSLAVLRQIYQTCKVNNINPIEVDGHECYVLLAHVYAINDLHADTSEFRETFNNAMPRGTDNPLFTRSAIYAEGIVVHEYNRVRRPYSASPANNEDSTFMCPVLGADALAMAQDEPRMVLRKEDAYGDIYGVGIKCVCGDARVEFEDRSDSTKIQQGSVQLNLWATA